VTDRLLVSADADGRMQVQVWRSGEQFPSSVGGLREMVWPLSEGELEDLRWYLEESLIAPFAVYGERGGEVEARFPEWGQRLFATLFGESGPAHDAYMAARGHGGGLEIALVSDSAQWLGLPWELMRDPSRPAPLVLDQVVVTRSLPSTDLVESFDVAGSRLRVLMVISRPEGPSDVGYQMVARPLLERLEAVRGTVELTVLRPPTFQQLGTALKEAAAAGKPFQVVHFDGHGVFGTVSELPAGHGPSMYAGDGPQGMLAFEKPGGGADLVSAERVAKVLAAGSVPVVVLNACQSAQVGGEVEAAVATRLLRGRAACVVAMAYSVYAVAAAEFMAVFYERLFAGDRIADAVTAGRAQLQIADKRPSPRGQLPLADWVIPVHYARRDVAFPNLHTVRKPVVSLKSTLHQIRTRDQAGNGEDGLAPIGTFVGRDALVYTLEAAAGLQRAVVLVGPGGTGKTELAKGFGRWWRDTGGVELPGLVFWHSFEPGVASFGLDGVLAGIGRRVFGAEFSLLDQDERHQVVEQLLAEHRCLLLWDNFESVHTMPDPADATPALHDDQLAELKSFVSRIAQGGRSALIITSRSEEAWLGEVRRVRVGGLNREEAILYADQLLAPFPSARVGRGLRAFDELMQWLDGHPLSMRLILPLLETNSPQHLQEGLKGITPLPVRDEGDRTTSLAASIAYSFTHLTHSDQQALTAISLFHGVTDTDVLGYFSQAESAPERFRGRTAEQWKQLLEGAAAVGLLTELGGGMFRIHPALPAYLAAQWRDDAPDAYRAQYASATRALLDAYAALSRWLMQQMSGGNAEFAVAVIDLQRRSLSSMLGYALDHQLFTHADAIARPLDDYWDLRGLTEEARGWVDRACQILEDANGTPPDLSTPAGDLWSFLATSQANRHLGTGQLDQAENTYQNIVDAYLQQPDTAHQRRSIAVLYHQLGMVAQKRRRLDDAERWYQRSLTLEEELGNRPGMATSYHQLGRMAQDRGRLDDAERWYQQSLAIKEDLGDRPGMATSYHQLGMVAGHRGRLDEAERWYRQSLAIEEELGNRPGMASSYHQLGIVALLRERLDEAERWYQRSLTIKEDLGDRPGLVNSYHQLGMVTQFRGRLDDAERWYQQSLTILEDLGDRSGMASSYGQLGLLAEERGQPQQALEWVIRCVVLFDEYRHPAAGPAPHHIQRLTHLLGPEALEQAWHAVTGGPLPPDVLTQATTLLEGEGQENA
jgi:tetratricopeptide (TPR) repeat protein